MTTPPPEPFVPKLKMAVTSRTTAAGFTVTRLWASNGMIQITPVAPGKPVILSLDELNSGYSRPEQKPVQKP